MTDCSDGVTIFCKAQQYGDGEPCTTAADFDVVYHGVDGSLTQHPACFTHGMAELDAHYRSGGTGSCELVPTKATDVEK